MAQKPKYMPIEEVKKRVAAGIENRRKKGLLPPITSKKIVTVQEGPSYTQEQRVKATQYTSICMDALCKGDRQDYIGSAVALYDLSRAAGYPRAVIASVFKGIAAEAAVETGQPFELMDNVARSWLEQHFTPSSRLFTMGNAVN